MFLFSILDKYMLNEIKDLIIKSSLSLGKIVAKHLFFSTSVVLGVLQTVVVEESDAGIKFK